MAATWVPLVPGGTSVKSVQATTEAAPVAGTESTAGINLTGVSALTFWLEADSGQTIAADTGVFDFYQADGDLGFWAYLPGVIVPVAPGSTGKRRVQIGTMPIDNGRGRLAAIANGLSVSSGGITLYMTATKRTPHGQVAV